MIVNRSPPRAASTPNQPHGCNQHAQGQSRPTPIRGRASEDTGRRLPTDEAAALSNPWYVPHSPVGIIQGLSGWFRQTVLSQVNRPVSRFFFVRPATSARTALGSCVLTPPLMEANATARRCRMDGICDRHGLEIGEGDSVRSCHDVGHRPFQNVCFCFSYPIGRWWKNLCGQHLFHHGVCDNNHHGLVTLQRSSRGGFQLRQQYVRGYAILDLCPRKLTRLDIFPNERNLADILRRNTVARSSNNRWCPIVPNSLYSGAFALPTEHTTTALL